MIQFYLSPSDYSEKCKTILEANRANVIPSLKELQEPWDLLEELSTEDWTEELVDHFESNEQHLDKATLDSFKTIRAQLDDLVKIYLTRKNGRPANSSSSTRTHTSQSGKPTHFTWKPTNLIKKSELGNMQNIVFRSFVKNFKDLEADQPVGSTL